MGKARNLLLEGYNVVACAQGGAISCAPPFLFLCLPHITYHFVSNMSDKDSDDLHKEVHGSPGRKTSITEVNLNKNLDAK